MYIYLIFLNFSTTRETNVCDVVRFNPMLSNTNRIVEPLKVFIANICQKFKTKLKSTKNLKNLKSKYQLDQMKYQKLYINFILKIFREYSMKTIFGRFISSSLPIFYKYYLECWEISFYIKTTF